MSIGLDRTNTLIDPEHGGRKSKILPIKDFIVLLDRDSIRLLLRTVSYLWPAVVVAALMATNGFH